jgi:hypothetical protein
VPKRGRPSVTKSTRSQPVDDSKLNQNDRGLRAVGHVKQAYEEESRYRGPERKAFWLSRLIFRSELARRSAQAGIVISYGTAQSGT